MVLSVGVGCRRSGIGGWVVLLMSDAGAGELVGARRADAQDSELIVWQGDVADIARHLNDDRLAFEGHLWTGSLAAVAADLSQFPSTDPFADGGSRRPSVKCVAEEVGAVRVVCNLFEFERGGDAEAFAVHVFGDIVGQIEELESVAHPILRPVHRARDFFEVHRRLVQRALDGYGLLHR